MDFPIPTGARPSAGQLEGFRAGLYDCLTKWPDALFELADAALCSPSPVGSVVADHGKCRFAITENVGSA
jgi:hypothetical protein